MSPLLQTARFFISAAQWSQLPDTKGLPEVAFVGRSNAGKSTMINVLCQQRRQAFASKTPGRTRLLNFFAIGRQDQTSGYLVDLPGYGYASVAQEQQSQWEGFLSKYLLERKELRGLVLLVDIRQGVTKLDLQMLQMMSTVAVPVHIVLTKADKLARGTAKQALLELRKNWPDSEVISSQTYSNLNKSGLEELTQKIESWLQPTEG